MYIRHYTGAKEMVDFYKLYKGEEWSDDSESKEYPLYVICTVNGGSVQKLEEFRQTERHQTQYKNS